MTENEAIEELKFNNEKCLEQCEGACSSRENTDCACQDAVYAPGYAFYMNGTDILLPEYSEVVAWMNIPMPYEGE